MVVQAGSYCMTIGINDDSAAHKNKRMLGGSGGDSSIAWKRWFVSIGRFSFHGSVLSVSYARKRGHVRKKVWENSARPCLGDTSPDSGVDPYFRRSTTQRKMRRIHVRNPADAHFIGFIRMIK